MVTWGSSIFGILLIWLVLWGGHRLHLGPIGLHGQRKVRSQRPRRLLGKSYPLIALLNGLPGNFTGKNHRKNGKIDGFRFRFCLQSIGLRLTTLVNFNWQILVYWCCLQKQTFATRSHHLPFSPSYYIITHGYMSATPSNNTYKGLIMVR